MGHLCSESEDECEGVGIVIRPRDLPTHGKGYAFKSDGRGARDGRENWMGGGSIGLKRSTLQPGGDEAEGWERFALAWNPNKDREGLSVTGGQRCAFQRGRKGAHYFRISRSRKGYSIQHNSKGAKAFSVSRGRKGYSIQCGGKRPQGRGPGGGVE